MANIFDQILAMSSAGMNAQTIRLKVVAENVAHVNAQAQTPGGEAYRRKNVVFRDEFDSKNKIKKIGVSRIVEDQSPLPTEYNPSHPGADEKGHVKKTNVESLIEIMDMREASNHHAANLKMYENINEIYEKTIDLLKVT